MSEPVATVVVPGMLCSPRLYQHQLPLLWRSGPVFIADHTRDPDISAIARRILAVAPREFALLGLSMGGYIAFEIVRQAPHRVLRLAVLDTSARPDQSEQRAVRYERIALAEGGRFSEIPELYFPLFVHPDRYSDSALRATVQQMALETGPEAFVRQQIANMNRPDAREHLARIRCPTTVIVGAEDQLTPLALSEEIAAAIPGARLTQVPNAGHLPVLEKPEETNRALSAWLSD
jgi:pimeloyl-ACP methyl ester carboxylesterase